MNKHPAVSSKECPEPKLALWSTILIWALRVFLFLFLAYIIWSILLAPIIQGIEIGAGIGPGGMG
jgi:hypothetical protein